MESTSGNKVKVIYTGGTIGSKPTYPDDPDSPQRVVPWDEFRASLPELDRLPFGVDAVSLPEPLDSCNVGPEEWNWMAKAIKEDYDDYTGFVILHGTDTIAYTASALSFMLRNLSKPVVLTGAQRSALVGTRNDAHQNLFTALEIAHPSATGITLIPEVCICFGGHLLRGNRTQKRDATGYEAFESPNFAPLAEVGFEIDVNERAVRSPPPPGRRLVVRSHLDTRVLPIAVMPGLQANNAAMQLLQIPDLRAAVVECFGSGNLPTHPDLLNAFRAAHDRGIVLVAVSQCPRGRVELGTYETSAELAEIGFISAADISTEAAICKLMVLLGDADLGPRDVEAAFMADMAGEQSSSQYSVALGGTGTAVGETQPYRLPGAAAPGYWTPQDLQRAVIRLHWATLETDHDPTTDPTEVEIYVDLGRDDHPDDVGATLIGRFSRWPTVGDPQLMTFPVTDFMRETMAPGERVAFTIFIRKPGAHLTWTSADLMLVVRSR